MVGVPSAGPAGPGGHEQGPGDHHRSGFRLGPIDLEVGWQERIAVLGPNGSGKTTLVRAALGLVRPAAGRAEIVGRPASAWSRRDLARVVGEKRAREIWFLLDKYDATTAERWGLVNKVVPKDELLPAAKEWGAKIAAYSPTALRFLKHSFNADTDHQGGLSQLAIAGLDSFAQTDEAKEGAAAFAEKRQPEFGKYVQQH